MRILLGIIWWVNFVAIWLAGALLVFSLFLSSELLFRSSLQVKKQPGGGNWVTSDKLSLLFGYGGLTMLWKPNDAFGTYDVAYDVRVIDMDLDYPARYSFLRIATINGPISAKDVDTTDMLVDHDDQVALNYPSLGFQYEDLDRVTTLNGKVVARNHVWTIITFPVWTLFIVWVLVTAFFYRKRWLSRRWRKRVIAGRCGRCDYHLHDLCICPECSEPRPMNTRS